MKRVVYFFAFLFVSLLFASCGTTGFADYYTPWQEDNFFPEESYLTEGESPIVIQTSDIVSKFREVSSKWYWCIGDTGFNGAELGGAEITAALTSLCKTKRAKIAIWSRNYTDTRSGVYSLPHTNYHTYTSANGFINSYTTTSYSTHSYSVARYDYEAYLFVQIPENSKILYKPGFSVCNLTQRDRDLFKQNTGCLINIVYKYTAAYYANLFHGDIITKVNGRGFLSAEDFIEFRRTANAGDVWNMTIIRDGQEKQITLVF
ncbi:MAG: PDZ domain-containing protein [Treponema sp.]|nr:PDZ domain-containing protein [Treponema sp.]